MYIMIHCEKVFWTRSLKTETTYSISGFEAFTAMTSDLRETSHIIIISPANNPGQHITAPFPHTIWISPLYILKIIHQMNYLNNKKKGDTFNEVNIATNNWHKNPGTKIISSGAINLVPSTDLFAEESPKWNLAILKKKVSHE